MTKWSDSWAEHMGKGRQFLEPRDSPAVREQPAVFTPTIHQVGWGGGRGGGGGPGGRGGGLEPHMTSLMLR